MIGDGRGSFIYMPVLTLLGKKKDIGICGVAECFRCLLSPPIDIPNCPGPDLQHAAHGLLVPVLESDIRASDLYSRAVRI